MSEIERLRRLENEYRILIMKIKEEKCQVLDTLEKAREEQDKLSNLKPLYPQSGDIDDKISVTQDCINRLLIVLTEIETQLPKRELEQAELIARRKELEAAADQDDELDAPRTLGL